MHVETIETPGLGDRSYLATDGEDRPGRRVVLVNDTYDTAEEAGLEG